MTTISVLMPHFPDEYGFDSPEALVASIDELLPDYDVEIRLPPGAGRGPDFWIEIARSLVVYVPWDSLNDALAEVLLTALAGWLVRRIQRRKQADAKTGDRLKGRNDALFPAEATREEKETLLRTTNYRVSVYDPEFCQRGPRVIIDVDQTSEETKITRYP